MKTRSSTATADLSHLVKPSRLTENPRDAWKDQQGFNPVSLGHWKSAAERAGISLVPADLVHTLPVETILDHDRPSAEQTVQLRAMSRAIANAVRHRTMFRWDCCAPCDTKIKMDHEDHRWDPSVPGHLHIDDPAAFECIYEFPGNTMRIWRRPWIQARIVDNYPVEYRVFVSGSQITGASNYYLQRPLPITPANLAEISACIHMTRQLISVLKPPFRLPAGCQNKEPGVHFTADFIATPGNILFLEGNPGFGYGAHPCCFPTDPSAWTDNASFLHRGVPVALRATTAP